MNLSGLLFYLLEWKQEVPVVLANLREAVNFRPAPAAGGP